MPSNINENNPVPLTPTTASVRTNFTHAKNEIEALQNAVIPTPVSVANGGTGATTASAARTALGITSQWINDQVSGGSTTWNGGTVTQNITLNTLAVPANFIIAATNAFPQNLAALGTLFFRGGSTTGTNSGVAIEAQATATWTSTSHPTQLNISTTPANGTLTTRRMQIGPTGGVGIGNMTAPSSGPNSGRGILNCEGIQINGTDLAQWIINNVL